MTQFYYHAVVIWIAIVYAAGVDKKKDVHGQTDMTDVVKQQLLDHLENGQIRPPFLKDQSESIETFMLQNGGCKQFESFLVTQFNSEQEAFSIQGVSLKQFQKFGFRIVNVFTERVPGNWYYEIRYVVERCKEYFDYKVEDSGMVEPMVEGQ